ncbi:MAG TPA: ferritin-like domain-containing protein [Candidatus Omnitrophota bacterium]|nr:ferritin-like domain-containing protein [Candidatus Omnitrophota bacterium]HPD85398.1 ferritin-like domain-containing protein [Candidatus Omnitrophota bacterium]HRZ04101.1 ferritin-like domain-containing protein [Candidatus Omnitrophota bacterium]
MGKKAREIVELDLKDLIKDLNRAYCDEWLAFYAWWYMAQAVEGKGYEDMAEFLDKISKDELEHAKEVAERIIELGGMPVNSLSAIEKGANNPYPGVMKNLADYDEIIKLVLEAEAGAIEVYNKIAKKTFGKDHDTYQLVTHIMGEEITHEEMFENLKTK